MNQVSPFIIAVVVIVLVLDLGSVALPAIGSRRNLQSAPVEPRLFDCQIAIRP